MHKTDRRGAPESLRVKGQKQIDSRGVALSLGSERWRVKNL